MSDQELLDRYTRERSEEAFATLVERYIRLVYSACRRQLHDAHLAEDAAQMVFELLSRKAAKLRHHPLGGWLITTAHYTCSNIQRSEHRRQRREQEAAVPKTPSAVQSSQQAELLEIVDAGLVSLRETDRQALVLRFMQEQPLGEVGRRLGISEDSARKRVSRGLEKLRDYLQARGITTDSAAIALALGDPGHAPPPALPAKIAQACRMHPPAPMWALGSKGTLAAGVAVAITAVGAIAASWGLFNSYSPATQPSGIAAAAEMPAAQAAPELPPSAPSSAVVMDESTPDNTLATLCRAMLAGDRAAMYGCLIDGPHDPPTLLDASIELGLADRQFELTAQAAYGDAANQLRGGLPASTVLQAMLVMRRLQGITVPIAGDRAVMHVTIPDALAKMVPDDAKPVMEAWAGKPIYFVLQDGNWKIDAARSVRWQVRTRHNNSSALIAPPLAKQTAITLAEVKERHDITRQIAAGELPRVQDEQREGRRLMMENVMDQFHIIELGTNLMPADDAKQ